MYAKAKNQDQPKADIRRLRRVYKTPEGATMAMARRIGLPVRYIGRGLVWVNGQIVQGWDEAYLLVFGIFWLAAQDVQPPRVENLAPRIRQCLPEEHQ